MLADAAGRDGRWRRHLSAGLRELGEETGVSEANATLIARAKEELLYDLPDELAGTLWAGNIAGSASSGC